MHNPGRSELILGGVLMIPGIIAGIFVDALPKQVLFDPRVVADSIVGAIFIGGWGLSEGGGKAVLVSMAFLGLALLSLLYYVGAVAVIVSVASIVRNS
ncbi:hypothetical protein [Natrialba sp. PRR66]|uniref:hypothetical protein n=1 Tax=Natrialba sp. PRR66 TaxID=3098146 RepID=UPI002B1DB5D2|nr:hypothetical protein [Natrialba sp. PRR66]